MKIYFSIIVIFLLCRISTYAQQFGITAEQTPIGFAASNSLGFNGTTGGKGGDTVYCPKGGDLISFLPAANPRVIIIDDTVTTGEIKGKKNISVIGRGRNAAMKGLAVTNCQNLVIRNITFFNSPDGLRITTTSTNATHHIWVDHCTFTDSPAVDPNGSSHDGLLDITHRSSWLTVSWCHFNNHRKTLLLGYSASGGSGETDSNQLMVTYHHNWFNKTFSRHPRARWGPVHVFNNYYLQNDYGIGSTCGARVLAEGNFFENTQVPILISQINDPGGTLSGDPVGYAKSVDNYIVGSGPLVENPGTWNFNPLTYYPYTYDAALSAKAAVMNGAGAGKIDPLVTVKDYGQNSVNPEEFVLQQNYPNPFNPSTTIRYALPAATNIIIEVYDALGKKVRTLVNGYQKAGNYGVEFDSENLSAGVYFYRITTNLGSLAKKMILAK